MPPLLQFTVTFGEPGRLVTGPPTEAAAWHADDDPAESDRIAARNRAAGALLRRVLPGLAEAAEENEAALETVYRQGLPPEAMIRRLHRRRVLAGPWCEGVATVTLFDGLATLDIAVAPDEVAALDATLPGLLRLVAEATGFLPWIGDRLMPPEEAARSLLAQHGPWLVRARRALWRQALLARLAWPTAALLGVAALLAGGVILAEALRIGTPAASADATRPASFVTERPLPVREAWLLPSRFDLLGRVAGEQVVVPVTRDMMLRAAPGAQFTVVPTQDPATPWLPQAMLAAAEPVVAIGGVGVQARLAFLVAPAPLALWAFLAAWPLWRARDLAARAAVGTQLLLMGAGGAAMLAARLGGLW